MTTLSFAYNLSPDLMGGRTINGKRFYYTRENKVYNQQAGVLIIHADKVVQWIGNSFIDQDYINHL